jgi:adenine C2-methylase RlmN of 23S rRNA A2503 and tRNA A37
MNDLYDLINVSNNLKCQLRLLRFNQCTNTKYKESPRVDGLIRTLAKTVKDFKYQLSPGSEISAACGMFLMKDMRN